jgi:hypothetical protein
MIFKSPYVNPITMKFVHMLQFQKSAHLIEGD